MIKIKMSECLIQRLKNINDKVSKLMISLSTRGVAEANLNKNYPDYLDFDGNLVTYINSNTVTKNKITEPWSVNTRQSTKAVRVLRRILTSQFVAKKLSEKEIESFVAEWQSSLEKTCTISVYKGWDILKAFNWKGEIDLKKFGTSCANFKQPKCSGWDEPKIKWFYFYIYNKNISVAVLKENGVIKARSVMFSGKQLQTDNFFKKGEKYTFMNNLYAEGDAKYKTLMRNWGYERGYIINENGYVTKSPNKTVRGGLIIPMKTHFKTYPPVDSAYVDTKKDVLSTNFANYRGGRRSAYKLCQNGGSH